MKCNSVRISYILTILSPTWFDSRNTIYFKKLKLKFLNLLVRHQTTNCSYPYMASLSLFTWPSLFMELFVMPLPVEKGFVALKAAGGEVSTAPLPAKLGDVAEADGM